MKLLYTLLAILTVGVVSAQVGTYEDGYTLRTFDRQGDSYLFLDGTHSDIWCLGEATAEKVEIVGNVYENGGGLTRHLEIDDVPYRFIHQSHGQRVFDRIQEIRTYPSSGTYDVTKFYQVINGEPTLIDDPEWAICYQNDYRQAETRVNRVSYYGTSYDGVGRVNGVDPLPIGLWDRSNNRYFRWINMESENTYRLQLINTSTRADINGAFIDVVYDTATGGVISVDGQSIPRSYTNWSYVSFLTARARLLY